MENINNINMAEVQEAVDKYVHLPKTLTSKAAVIESGLMTEHDWALIPYAERSSPMQTNSRWAKVRASDGIERSLMPFSSLLTEEEHAIYNNVRAERKTGIARPRAQLKKADIDFNADIDRVLEDLFQADVPDNEHVASAIAKLKALKKVAKDNDLMKYFNVSCIEDLPEQMTVQYLMFRTMDEEFADDCMITECPAGMIPYYGLKDVKDMLDKMEKKIPDIKSRIVGLKPAAVLHKKN